jgi:hypothetical protein
MCRKDQIDALLIGINALNHTTFVGYEYGSGALCVTIASNHNYGCHKHCNAGKNSFHNSIV